MGILLQWAHHCTVPASRTLEDLDTYHRSKDIFLILFLEQQKHIGQQDSEDICRDQHTEEGLSGHMSRGARGSLSTMMLQLLVLQVPTLTHPIPKFLSLESQHQRMPEALLRWSLQGILLRLFRTRPELQCAMQFFKDSVLTVCVSARVCMCIGRGLYVV